MRSKEQSTLGEEMDNMVHQMNQNNWKEYVESHESMIYKSRYRSRTSKLFYRSFK